MRKCLRCQHEMIEDYGLKIESVILAGIAPVKLSKEQGVFSDAIEVIKAAVCPACGEVSLYIEQLDKIKP